MDNLSIPKQLELENLRRQLPQMSREQLEDFCSYLMESYLISQQLREDLVREKPGWFGFLGGIDG